MHSRRCSHILKIAILITLTATPTVLAAGDSRLRYRITDLGPGQALAINDGGMVAGTQGTYPNIEAVVWKKTGVKTLGPGFAYGITNKGRIVGSQRGRAVQWWNGKLTKLGALPQLAGVPLKVYDSLACGANDRGQVVGITDFTLTYKSNSINRVQYLSHVFLCEYGLMRDLGDSGSSGTAAINNNGQVACVLGDSATLWTDGIQTQVLAPIGYDNLTVEGLSDNGTIVGSMMARGNGDSSSQGFIWANGSTYGIGTLGGRNSVAFAVNNYNMVVGTAATRPVHLFGPDGARHAFLWQRGRMVDLNSITDDNEHWLLESANAVNNVGQIAGFGKLNGAGHAFLLTPVSGYR